MSHLQLVLHSREGDDGKAKRKRRIKAATLIEPAASAVKKRKKNRTHSDVLEETLNTVASVCIA